MPAIAPPEMEWENTFALRHVLVINQVFSCGFCCFLIEKRTMYTHTPHCTLNFPARNPGVSSPLSKSHCGARIGCTPCPQTHLRFLVTKKRRNAFKFFCGEKKPWVKISKTTFFFPGIAWHRVTEGYVCRLVSFFVKDKDVCLELYFPSEKTMNYKVKSSFAPWQTNAYTSTQTLSKQKLRIQLLCTT